jgi:hypothetical protein
MSGILKTISRPLFPSNFDLSSNYTFSWINTHTDFSVTIRNGGSKDTKKKTKFSQIQ